VRLFDLAWKDILEIGRDWKSALFLVVMPILFTLFFGLILDPAFEAEDGDERLMVGLIDHDRSGELGPRLETLLAQSDVIRPGILESDGEDDLEALVEDETMAAIVLVPTGFSVDALGGDLPTLPVIADLGTQAGQTAGTAIETAVSRLASAVRIAQISAQALEERQGFGTLGEREAYVGEASQLVVDAWREPPILVESVPSGSINMDETMLESGFVQSSPGMMVQFAIFGLITAAMVLVLERKSGALARLLTTPISRAEVIGGHTVAMFVIILAQQILLVVIGQLLFEVEYSRAPIATLLMVTTLSLWAASLGLLIGVVARTEDQVVTISLVAMFVFAALGGAWFPLEVAGEAFAAIGHVMPTAWAMEGLQNVVVRGLGLESVLVPTGLLIAYTAIFFGLAVWRFQSE
jgi:ABC-2 type transport system permease protein